MNPSLDDLLRHRAFVTGTLAMLRQEIHDERARSEQLATAMARPGTSRALLRDGAGYLAKSDQLLAGLVSLLREAESLLERIDGDIAEARA